MEFRVHVFHMQSLVYTSTCFCQCEEEVLEERTYPARVDPEIVMELCETLDEESLEAMRPPWVSQTTLL